jgi:alginate O-acetyltransferase complex protein AlgI
MNKWMVDGVRFGKPLELIYPVTIIALFLVCVSYLVKGTYNPFIYFNF